MKDMKESDKGIVGGSNGALGGASKSDLEKGYMPVECDEYNDMDYDDPMPKEDRDILDGGFAGRPKGWER